MRCRRGARGLVAALLFSAFGLCVEVLFTGLKSGLRGDLMGTVSLLMVPVYSSAYVLIGAVLHLGWWKDLPATLRVAITVVAIYTIEWGFGVTYHALGFEPWRYDHGAASEFSGGHVTLLYLPFWCIFALVVIPARRFARDAAARIVPA